MTLLLTGIALCLGLIGILAPVNVLASLRTATERAPLVQSVQATFPVYYLTPDASTAAQLQTHTAEFQIAETAGGPLSVTFLGLYRFKNEESDPIALQLTFRHDGVDENAPPITLSANGTPIIPAPIEDGYQAEIGIAPDSSLDLRLTYSSLFETAPLAILRYDVRNLVGWPGSSSLRTTIVMPESIEPESWIDLAPDGWNYVTTSDANTVGIHWLYDGAFPLEAFLFQFVSPDTWRQISTLSATSALDLGAAIELGNLYQQLYDTLPADLVPETRYRFYAQALAVYTSGIKRATANGDPTAAARLQTGLASLYRGQILEADGAPDPDYLALMVQATGEALAGLPVDDGQRTELAQWQADGLRQLLVNAQRQGDWPSVLALLEQMEALPQPPLSIDALAEARRSAKVLQALELLENGQRDAALALAGDEIVEETLRPGPELQGLFAGWQVTMTITTTGIDLHLVATPAPGQLEPARSALEEQLDRWKTLPVRSKASVQMTELTLGPDDAALRLDISAPDREAALTLAQATAVSPDSALLRTVLEQVAPLIQTRNQRLRRRLTMEQTLDLRGVGAQWTAMADNLENEAAAIESSGRGVNPNDPAAVEAALRARIQASNYRIASRQWRNLASNSWVTTELKSSAGDIVGNAASETSRSWLATVDTPIQTYTLRAETLNPTRVSLLALALLGLLLLFSGLLYRLL